LTVEHIGGAMHAYKSQLRERLMANGWEVVAVEEGFDWWADEHWMVQSRRNLWGHEVVLTFIVHPLWDAPRKRGQGVWEVVATEAIPEEQPVGEEEGITWLYLTKGRFDHNLDAFVRSLNDYRNRLEEAQREAPEP
jgi:hypothetical protein